MKEHAMDGAEVLPKPVVFLLQIGNWPLCRTAKCKKNGTLAVYCELEGKKPTHCTKCKSSMEVKLHFVNLKGYLHSKGELDTYNVDQIDSEMCATFGVLMEESGKEDGSATDSS